MRIRWIRSTGRAVSLDTVSRHMTAALRDEGAEVIEGERAGDAAIAYHHGRTREDGPQCFRDGEDPRVAYALVEATAVAPWMVRVLSACDQVWVPSGHALAGALESGVPARRLRIVPHGVSPVFGRSYPTDRPSLRALLANGGPLIGWSYAHSWERKNGEAVCQLLTRVAERRPDVRFVVKTLPEQREMIVKTFERMGAPLWRTTVIAERWSEPDLATWYRALAVFVYPTRGGAFELPPLEALASGVRVVVPAEGPCVDYAAGVVEMVPVKGRSPLFSDLIADGNGQIGDGYDVDEDALYDATLRALDYGPLPREDAYVVATRWTWHAAARIALTCLGEPPDCQPMGRPRLWVWTSGREQCGIRAYSDALDDGLRAIGRPPLTRPLPDRGWLREVAPGDGVLVHFDPGLLGGLSRDAEPPLDAFRASVARIVRRGGRVVLCCHYFDGEALSIEGVSTFALHRDYGVTDPRCVLIPHGAIPYEPPASREALRAAYGLPTDVPILTTAGFLAPWKQTPMVLRALAAALGDRRVHVQVLAGRHFSGCHESEEAALAREAQALGERATVITAFLPDREVFDRLHASTLGFLYHGQHTGSVSGASKLFVSARCPLVVSGSRHDADMRHGVVVSPSLDIDPFVATVLRVLDDPQGTAHLRAEMGEEYRARAMDRIARRYVEAFGW